MFSDWNYNIQMGGGVDFWFLTAINSQKFTTQSALIKVIISLKHEKLC